nr:hypothetical protein [Clostridioides sp.]
MRKVNKLFYLIATLIEVLLLIGVYVVNYFTITKMGMLRHVMHKNSVWEDKYPIVVLLYITVIVLVVLMISVLVLYNKKKEKLKNTVLPMNIFMVVLGFFYIGFILLYSTEKLNAYYYMSFMLGVAALIQTIKTFVAVILCKKEK